MAPQSQRGVTLLEMMAALVILSLLLTLVHLSLDGITPRWQLRASAHQVEGIVRWAQNAAAIQGRPVQIMYDVPQGSFWARIGEATYSLHTLPGSIHFERVRFANGDEVMRDVAAVRAYPDGTLDFHTVVLGGPDNERATLTFERLTGELTYVEESGDIR